MKISIDFHFFHFKDTIGDTEYEYKSTGGRVFLVFLFLGMIAKMLGYLSLGTWPIIGIAIGSCVLWDLLTAGLYLLKVKRKLNKYMNDESEN